MRRVCSSRLRGGGLFERVSLFYLISDTHNEAHPSEKDGWVALPLSGNVELQQTQQYLTGFTLPTRVLRAP